MRSAVALALLIGTGLLAPDPQPSPTVPTGRQLAARVVEARRVAGARARVRLTRTDSRDGTRTVTILLVKTRTYRSVTTTLYQVDGPASARPQALVVESAAGRPATATWLDGPEAVLSLRTRENLDRPFFESDLRIADLTDDVLTWPTQRITGDGGEVLRHRCLVLESRPEVVASGSAEVVRSWIAPDLNLPLRIEWFGDAGQLLRRLTVGRLTRDDGGPWAAASVTVEAGDGLTRTTLDAIRGDRRATVSLAEFSIDTIRQALRARSKAPAPTVQPASAAPGDLP